MKFHVKMAGACQKCMLDKHNFRYDVQHVEYHDPDGI